MPPLSFDIAVNLTSKLTSFRSIKLDNYGHFAGFFIAFNRCHSPGGLNLKNTCEKLVTIFHLRILTFCLPTAITHNSWQSQKKKDKGVNAGTRKNGYESNSQYMDLD